MIRENIETKLNSISNAIVNNTYNSVIESLDDHYLDVHEINTINRIFTDLHLVVIDTMYLYSAIVYLANKISHVSIKFDSNGSSRKIVCEKLINTINAENRKPLNPE